MFIYGIYEREETGCCSVFVPPCGDTLLIFIGPSLKVSLMVHLCLVFVLLQWKLQNKKGQTTQ